MSDFLGALERQLIDAVERRAEHASPQPGHRRARQRHGATMLLAIALALAAVVLAVSVLDRGSGARSPTRHAVKIAIGIPPPGASRLSSLSVPDPAGGAPWGMRIVHTSTNLVCVQIGQRDRGQLRPLGGVLGDGVVHLRLPPAPPASKIGNGLVETPAPRVDRHGVQRPRAGNCQPAGTVFAAYSADVARSPAVLPVHGGPTRWRSISFGLLGPDALSVTYSFRGRSRSQAVEPGSGAYLIVLPAGGATGGTGPGTGEAAQRVEGRRAGTSGALTAITYRFGAKTCRIAARRALAGHVESCQGFGGPTATR